MRKACSRDGCPSSRPPFLFLSVYMWGGPENGTRVRPWKCDSRGVTVSLEFGFPPVSWSPTEDNSGIWLGTVPGAQSLTSLRVTVTRAPGLRTRVLRGV